MQYFLAVNYLYQCKTTCKIIEIMWNDIVVSKLIIYIIFGDLFPLEINKNSSISKSIMLTSFQACVNSHDFSSFFLLQTTNNETTFIVVIMNYPNIWKLECFNEISAKKVTKAAPTSEDFLGSNSSNYVIFIHQNLTNLS